MGNFFKNIHPLLRRTRNETNYDGANYAILNAINEVLGATEKETIDSKMQSSLDTATGYWLDQWGDWFGVYRRGKTLMVDPNTDKQDGIYTHAIFLQWTDVQPRTYQSIEEAKEDSLPIPIGCREEGELLDVPGRYGEYLDIRYVYNVGREFDIRKINNAIRSIGIEQELGSLGKIAVNEVFDFATHSWIPLTSSLPLSVLSDTYLIHSRIRFTYAPHEDLRELFKPFNYGGIGYMDIEGNFVIGRDLKEFEDAENLRKLSVKLPDTQLNVTIKGVVSGLGLSEDDEHYRERIIRYVLLKRGTIPAIQDAIRDWLDDPDANVTIYEPWKNIFYTNKSKLNGSDHLMGYYYRYGIIDITVDQPFTPDIANVINRFKPAGVKWYLRMDRGSSINTTEVTMPIADIEVFTERWIERLHGLDGSLVGEINLFEQSGKEAEGDLFITNKSDLNGPHVLAGNPERGSVIPHAVGYEVSQPNIKKENTRNLKGIVSIPNGNSATETAEYSEFSLPLPTSVFEILQKDEMEIYTYVSYTQSFVLETDATDFDFKLSWFITHDGHNKETPHIEPLSKNRYFVWSTYRSELTDERVVLRLLDLTNCRFNNGTYVRFSNHMLTRGDRPPKVYRDYSENESNGIIPQKDWGRQDLLDHTTEVSATAYKSLELVDNRGLVTGKGYYDLGGMVTMLDVQRHLEYKAFSEYLSYMGKGPTEVDVDSYSAFLRDSRLLISIRPLSSMTVDADVSIYDFTSKRWHVVATEDFSIKQPTQIISLGGLQRYINQLGNLFIKVTTAESEIKLLVDKISIQYELSPMYKATVCYNMDVDKAPSEIIKR